MAELGPTLYGLNFNGAWSVPQSKRSDWFLNGNKDTPFPGQYNPTFTDKPRSPKWGIGTSKRQGLEQKGPSAPVGRYNISSDIKDNDNPAFTIGSKLPTELKKNAVGPTTYNPKPIAQAPPQFTFGYKEDHDWARDGPAPNLYQTVLDEERMAKTSEGFKTRKTGFGTSSRNFMPKSIDLGPGQYNVTDTPTLAPKVSFTKSLRDPLKKFVGPGPGQYQIKLVHSKSQGISIGNKYVPFKTSDVENPGPGTYDAAKPRSMQNTRFGREGKFEIVDKEQMLKPGPGDYDQKVLPDKVSHLDSQSIGLSIRPPIANTNKVPGPGQYEIDSRAVEGPKYTLRPKHDRVRLNQNPGPGQYEPDNVYEKPPYHYTIPYTSSPGLGRANRSTPVYSKFNNVGPGSYNLRQNVGGNKMSIGKAPRFKDRELEDVGPALYRVPDTIGKLPKYLVEKNRESQFMTLQAQEQKIKSGSNIIA